MSEKMDPEKEAEQEWVTHEWETEQGEGEKEEESQGEEEEEEEDEEEEEEEEGSVANEDKDKESVTMSIHVDLTPAQELESNVVLRRFLLEVFSGLYAILMVALGIVLPITIFLSGGNFNNNGLHVTIFHLYMYIVATIFCVYLTVIVRKYKKVQTNQTTSQHDVTDNVSDVSTKGTYVINENVHAVRPEGSYDVTEEGVPQTGSGAPLIYEIQDGVNFFLRMGLIAFGLGGVLLDGIRTVEYSRIYVLWECYGSAHLASVIFKLIFILVQSFTLFKYHAVGLNVHKPLVKLGLLHTAATNLSSWVTIIVIEAVEDYNENVHYEQSLKSTTIPIPTNTTGNNTTVGPEVDDDDMGAALCVSFPDTLSSAASPFLFPFIIEYSLLAAAILYKMHSYVGPEKYHQELQRALLHREDKVCSPELYPKQDNASECSKANSGLFFGLAIFTAAVTGVCFYLYFSMQDEKEAEMAVIYIVSDLILKVLTFVTIIFAYWQILKLCFYGISESLLDQNILVFTLFGAYLLDGFVMVAASYQISSEDPATKRTSQMIVAGTVLNFIQVTCLTAFIIDGLHRRSVTSQQMTEKPGRSLVTFLLILNLAMWLVNTFEMKLIHQFSIFYGFYGHLAWTIIMGVTAPVAVYFRFHCAVCLSAIWTGAYTKEPMEKITEIKLEKIGKIL